MLDFKVKVTRSGDTKWVGMREGCYALVGEGTTSRVLVDSYDVVRVERAKDGKGWDVIVYGEVAEHCRTKVDAQGAALYDWLGYKFAGFGK